MIKQISWASYWSFIAIILIFYYGFVCFRYYYSEIKQIFTAKSKLHFAKDSGSDLTTADDDLFPVINQVCKEIEMSIENAAAINTSKKEMLQAIQLALNKYPSIKNSSFKAIVNNYISTEFSKYCSIHLDKEEIDTLWVN